MPNRHLYLRQHAYIYFHDLLIIGILYLSELKSIQTSSSIETKTLESSASFNLKPPPMDRHKSFDDDDFSNKPVVKRTNIASINARVYSIADLQIATGSFSVENFIGEGSIGRVYRAQFDDGKVYFLLVLTGYFCLLSISETTDDFFPFTM